MSKANELLRLVRASVTLTPEINSAIDEYLAEVDSIQLIIAGSSRQAAHIAKAKGVQRYTCIANAQALTGARRGGKIWLYGTYYSLPGWRILRELAKAYGYELVVIDE